MALLDWYIRANLKIRHFQMLVALADFRTLARASMFLSLREAQLSKMLSGLESSLGVPLFISTANGMEATEHGACLIKHGRSVLNRLLNAQEELRDLREGRLPRVSLGISPSITANLMPSFVIKMERESVPVALAIREGSLSNLLHDLRAGVIDFAISVLPKRPLGDDLISEPLYEQPMTLVVRSDHPLTKCHDVQWNVLEQYPVVLTPNGTLIRQYIDTFLAQNNISMSRLQVESSSILTNIGVLQSTDSIAFMSRDVAQQFEEAGLVTRLPLQMPNHPIRIGLVRMKDRHMVMELKLVHMVLHECVSEGQFQQPEPKRPTHGSWLPPAIEQQQLLAQSFW